MAPTAAEAVAGEVAGLRGAETWSRTLRQLRRSPLSVAGSVIVLSLIVVALTAPHLGLADPVKLNVGRRFVAPGAEYWFGTDHLGRDVFSRVLHGARFSLLMGALTIV